MSLYAERARVASVHFHVSQLWCASYPAYAIWRAAFQGSPPTDYIPSTIYSLKVSWISRGLSIQDTFSEYSGKVATSPLFSFQGNLGTSSNNLNCLVGGDSSFSDFAPREDP